VKTDKIIRKDKPDTTKRYNEKRTWLASSGTEEILVLEYLKKGILVVEYLNDGILVVEYLNLNWRLL
jgi:hypothetical protein